MRLRAPIWADRVAAKPFSGERDTLDLRGNRRHPSKGNHRRSVRQRVPEISGLTLASPGVGEVHRKPPREHHHHVETHVEAGAFAATVLGLLGRRDKRIAQTKGRG